MAEYIKLNDVIEIAEQQGHVTLDDLLACDTLQIERCRQCKYRKDRLYCRRIADRPVIVCDTDFCSYGKA